MGIDDKFLLTCGLLIVGGVAAAEATTLVGTAITSYTEYKKQIKEYVTYTPREREFRCLVRPSYWGIFKRQVKDVHRIIYSHNKQPTNYNNF